MKIDLKNYIFVGEGLLCKKCYDTVEPASLHEAVRWAVLHHQTDHARTVNSSKIIAN